jgi:hypothetical protein
LIDTYQLDPGTRWHQPSQQFIQEDENPFVIKDLGNGQIIRCYAQRMIPHIRFDYKICEYISDGSNKVCDEYNPTTQHCIPDE